MTLVHSQPDITTLFSIRSGGDPAVNFWHTNCYITYALMTQPSMKVVETQDLASLRGTYQFVSIDFLIKQ